MNKLRRKQIALVIIALKELLEKASNDNMNDIIEQLEDLICDIRDILDEEEEYRDNMPENLQNSARYEKAEEACDNIECAADELESIEEDDDIDYVVKTIDKAIEFLHDATV